MKRVLKITGITILAIGLILGAAWWWFLHPNFVAAPSTLRGETSTHAAEVGGRHRTWHAYVPPRLAEAPSLVLVLHGSNGDGEMMMQWSSYGFHAAADKYGFIAIYPDGWQRYWNDCRRNAGYPANRNNIDDVGFLRHLVRETARTYSLVDPRVFVTGISNGGHMAYRLAYEAPDLVDGIAAIVANVPAPGNLACDQSGTPVATLILNGTEDPINPYGGGIVNVFGDTTRGEVLSARVSAEYWAGLAGYRGPPREVTWPDRDPHDGTRVVVARWSAADKVPVELITVRGGGHSLPHPVSNFPRILGPTSHEFDTAEVIWNFFRHIH